MNRDKTRLFIAVTGGSARDTDDPDDAGDRQQSRTLEPQTPPAASGSAPALRGVPPHDDEQTRFLPVELLLEQQRRENGQHAAPREPAGASEASAPVQASGSGPRPALGQLDDTDFRWAFANATLAGRARRAWKSLSIVSRISVVLAVLVALLVLLPRVLPAALESAGPLTRATLARAESRPAAAPVASGRAGPAATGAAQAKPSVAVPAVDLPADGAGALPAAPAASPRAAADAVAQGRCAAAVALYGALARQHPELEVYREAARILKQQYPGCAEGQ
jgi:hypothetical protein